MTKIVALVRSASGSATEAEGDSWWPQVEAGARAYAAEHPELAGLVLSRVVKPFADDDPLVALVAPWVECIGVQEVAERLAPSA